MHHETIYHVVPRPKKSTRRKNQKIKTTVLITNKRIDSFTTYVHHEAIYYVSPYPKKSIKKEKSKNQNPWVN